MKSSDSFVTFTSKDISSKWFKKQLGYLHCGEIFAGEVSSSHHIISVSIISTPRLGHCSHYLRFA